jgi:hypothetical protein
MEIRGMISFIKETSEGRGSGLSCRAEDINPHGIFWPAALV